MGKTVFKLTDAMKEKLVSLYEEGKMDSEIAKELGVVSGTIFYWRKKLGLKTKFTYDKVSKIDNEKFEQLFKQGLSDAAIARELNMSGDGVYSHRQRYGYFRDKLIYNKPIPLTKYQKEVLVGTLLGDASLRRKKSGYNPSLSCGHCPKQKPYCELKVAIFESIGAKLHYSKRNFADPRNGKFYEVYTLRTPANPKLIPWYKAFYPNRKKVIPKKMFKYFTAVSLAFLYMDDGCKTNKTYSIATNCFSKEDITVFREMLKSKFNLDTTMNSNNVVYIKMCSKNLFESLISPYMCDCMKYKLHCVL